MNFITDPHLNLSYISQITKIAYQPYHQPESWQLSIWNNRLYRAIFFNIICVSAALYMHYSRKLTLIKCYLFYAVWFGVYVLASYPILHNIVDIAYACPLMHGKTKTGINTSDFLSSGGWYIIRVVCHQIRLTTAVILNKMICDFHDDVIKWKHFPRHWSFVRGIHQSPLNSPHKGQWRVALYFLWSAHWRTVEQTIVRLVIWYAIPPIWCLCNVRKLP